MHMKGAVACRGGPSPGFSVCLSAVFPRQGRGQCVIAVMEMLSCTLCSNSERRSTRSEFHCKDEKCYEGGCPKQHALSGNEWT